MEESAYDICQGKRARIAKERHKGNPSLELVAFNCRLYGGRYDEREEDSKIKGLNWEPGMKANHKSIRDIFGLWNEIDANDSKQAVNDDKYIWK